MFLIFCLRLDFTTSLRNCFQFYSNILRVKIFFPYKSLSQVLETRKLKFTNNTVLIFSLLIHLYKSSRYTLRNWYLEVLFVSRGFSLACCIPSAVEFPKDFQMHHVFWQAILLHQLLNHDPDRLGTPVTNMYSSELTVHKQHSLYRNSQNIPTEYTFTQNSRRVILHTLA